MACVIGGLVYWICLMLDMRSVLAQIIGGITVFVARILAVKYKITLPDFERRSGALTPVPLFLGLFRKSQERIASDT